MNCLRRPFQGRALPVSYLGTGTIKDSTEKRTALKSENALQRLRDFRETAKHTPVANAEVSEYNSQSTFEK